VGWSEARGVVRRSGTLGERGVISRPSPFGGRDELPQMFFRRLDVALHHTLRQGVQWRSSRFAQLEAL
jgi:hypothetical protein